MSKNEALKMAIEALEQAKKQLEKYWSEDLKRGYDIEDMNESPIILCEDTIKDCRKALEQPAQGIELAWYEKGWDDALLEWQGLTDDEMWEIEAKCLVGNPADWEVEPKRFARAIEQALKDKNT